MLAFEVGNKKEDAFAFLNGLQLFTISNNLGDAKNLTTHPATTTHQRLTARAELGIFDNTVRIRSALKT